MRTAFLLLLIAFCAGPSSSAAQPHGLSYEVAPVGARVFWDDDAGLSDGFLWGGDVGVGFGQSLTLQGTYLVGRNLETDFSGFAGDKAVLRDALVDVTARSVNARRYGGRLRLSLGSSGLAPYLSAGGGVFRLDPDNLSATRHLYALVGAGLTLSGARRYALTVGGQLLTYRYEPADLLSKADLAAAGLTRSDLDTRTVYNPSLRAALSIYLGGRPRGTSAFLGQGARAFLAPFYGEIAFDDALAFPERQALAGVRGGLRFGPYAELSGFYARGTEDADLLDTDLPSAFEDVQLYGGELGLRLENMLGRGIVPHLSLGGGYADVLSGYTGRQEARPEDRFFGLGGGGVEIPLIGPLRLNGDARALLTSGSDVADVETTSDLHTSLLYSAGLTFALNRERRSFPSRERLETTTPPARAAAPAVQEQPSSPAEENKETPARSNVSDETITLPVPENGELYLRFGAADSSVFRSGRKRAAASSAPSSSPTREELRDIVRETVREAVAEQTEAGRLSAEQVRRITREVLGDQLQRLNDNQQATLRTQTLRQRIDRLEERLQERSASVALRNDAGDIDEPAAFVAEEKPESGPRLLGQPLVAAWPHTGLRFGEGPTQIALGVRGDYRSRNGWFRLLPEAALGFGGGTSITALLNAAAPVPYARRYVAPYAPYLGLGLGLASEKGLVGLEPGLNLLVGTEYSFQYGVAFAEFNTFGLFDSVRLMWGYRLTF